ncbi:MAG: dephospho-CoA kinase [Aerococcus sp.]|nr:dephospho-CoA kinase [Aerococcus sp.]
MGLTGSIATGKSTVSRYLKQRGIPVIDFDQMVHNLQQPNTPTLAALQAQFGPEIVTRDGALDRKHLAKRVFNDSEALERLNHTMRPFIVGALQEQLEVARLHQTPLVVLDIPLLFEQHYQWWCDQVIVVSTSPRLQLERLMARNNLSKSDAELRIASQIPLVDKEQRADAVIDNSGTIDDTYCQVDQWLSELEHAFHFTKE